MDTKTPFTAAILAISLPLLAAERSDNLVSAIPQITCHPASKQLTPIVELLRQLQIHVYGLSAQVDSTLARTMERLLSSGCSISLLSGLLPPLKSVMDDLAKIPGTELAVPVYHALRDAIIGALNSLYRDRLALAQRAVTAVKKLN